MPKLLIFSDVIRHSIPKNAFNFYIPTMRTPDTTEERFQMPEGQRILGDCLSEWMPFLMWAKVDNHPFPTMKPRHYRDRLLHQEQHGGYGEGYCERVIAESDPDTMARFDALVDEFIIDLPRIQDESDKQTALQFCDRAEEIVLVQN